MSHKVLPHTVARIRADIEQLTLLLHNRPLTVIQRARVTSAIDTLRWVLREPAILSPVELNKLPTRYVHDDA